MSFSRRAPSEKGGARPSLETLGQICTYTSVGPQSLGERDLVLYANSAYCVVKKSSRFHRGSYVTLRELVTNRARTVRIEPQVTLTRLDLKPVITGDFDGRWDNWKLGTGDVVLYPALFPESSILAIRTGHGWLRTSAPWTPFADAEIVHDVMEGQAAMVRSNIRTLVGDPQSEFAVGSTVATKVGEWAEPSVWFRQSENHWVSNCRGIALSDQMIRYELERGTYQVLRIPED